MKRWTICVLMSVAACANQPALQATAGGVAVVSSLPAPAATDYAPSRIYRIGPLDKLTYSVYGIEELRGELQADAGGRISIPLAGSLMAAGKTSEQLATEIAERLRASYVRNPQVTVNLQDVESQRVSVDGEVREPGLYPVSGDLTLMSAIASARGVTANARLQDVVVFRTVEGKRYATLYNLSAIRRGAYDDPAIYPNDVVVVGESRSRRLFNQFLQFAPVLAAPLTILLTNNNN